MFVAVLRGQNFLNCSVFLLFFVFEDNKRLLYRLCGDAEDTDVSELCGLAHHRIVTGAMPSGHGMESSLSICSEVC